MKWGGLEPEETPDIVLSSHQCRELARERRTEAVKYFAFSGYLAIAPLIKL
ncbi:hypothetical protein [Mastigocoleus testarum]|uniref:hypothetical protein n=1 Tax=Mastigocoleus testarum TaxID=996925 RepID=UPI0004008F0F|nr:hypothetical protein [Mastigocoleus testarum]